MYRLAARDAPPGPAAAAARTYAARGGPAPRERGHQPHQPGRACADWPTKTGTPNTTPPASETEVTGALAGIRATLISKLYVQFIGDGHEDHRLGPLRAGGVAHRFRHLAAGWRLGSLRRGRRPGRDPPGPRAGGELLR